MYCKHCGKQIDDDSKFCQLCGKKLDTIVEQDYDDMMLERTKREFKESIDRKYGSTADKYKEEEEKHKQLNDTIAVGISIATGWKLGKALSDFAGYRKIKEEQKNNNL